MTPLRPALDRPLDTVERMVNALPPLYILPPISGELFDSLEHCNRRLELKARKELARERATVTPEAEVVGILVQDTPPRPGSKFQGGPSVTLAIRSPEGPPRASPARSPITVDPVTFRLSQEDPYAPQSRQPPQGLLRARGA